MLNPWGRRSQDASLWQDLRSGEAGWAPRVGLSLAAATALAAAALLVLATLNVVLPPLKQTFTQRDGTQQFFTQSPIRDYHIAGGLLAAGAVWCVALITIWSSYRRFRLALQAIIGVVGIWGIAIPLCMMLEAWLRNEELWISACILAASTGTFYWVTRCAYLARRGVPLINRDGHVNVHCPVCGYAMIGLTEARCPECGAKFTLDELIRRQDFGRIQDAPSPPAAQPNLPGPRPTEGTAR